MVDSNKKLPRMYTVNDEATEQKREADESSVDSEDPMDGEDYVAGESLLTGKLGRKKPPKKKKRG